jgi:uncharacterized protein
MKLNKKVILITGASKGIGEATARQCAAQGARLVLAARSAETLRKLEQQIRADGGEAISIPTDVSNKQQVAHLVQSAISHYGHIDVLVNNAGYGVYENIRNLRFEDLEGMVNVNLYGAVHCAEAVLPHMLERRKPAQIVNVASISGLIASNNQSFYCATKFALVGLTRTMQIDLRGTKVRCALICPGAVHTDFITADVERHLTRLSRLIPRLDADDVARAIVRAIKRRSNGETVIPALVRPFVLLSGVCPACTRTLMRLFG